jgi:mono/diheme cytochrome c family protein
VFRVAVFLAVIATLTGCGSGQSDSSQVSSVTRRYFAALASGNAAEACSLVSEAAKLRFHRVVNAVTPNVLRSAAVSCTKEIAVVPALLDPSAHAQLRHVALGVPRVSGRTATVPAVVGSRAVEVPLAKTSAGWRINGVDGHLVVSTIVGTVGAGVEPACCSSGGPAELSIQPPPAVARAGGTQLAEFKLGGAVVAQSGCLACHRLGENGNRGPGPDLTYVGSRLSPARVERAIINPTEPMPSFKHLPTAKLKALVLFLSLLRH